MDTYQNQLTEKRHRLKTLLAPFQLPDLAIFPSPEYGYRMRAEFRIWHDKGSLSYAMTDSAGNIVCINQFPPAFPAVNALMPRLLEAVKSRELLRRKLFQAQFHCTLAGEMMVTLIYHKPLSEAWQSEAEALAQHLGDIQLIGRARKQKIVLGREYVRETLKVHGQHYHYRQYESSFCQPNARICRDMLAWSVNNSKANGGDLLELYCGNGNFTLPLSRNFQRVLATEVSKSGIRALRENIAINNIHNIAVARLSAEEYTQAANGSRIFKRLQQDNIDLACYRFSTVLVDPPRAGIDDATLQLLQGFSNIIYISCNPETLAANLNTLTRSHTITAAALFDQFPHTPHIESGIILKKRP